MSELDDDIAQRIEETIRLRAPGDPGQTIRVDAASLPAAAFDHSATRFRLLEEIGRGGMGVVFRAQQASLDREVAIKKVQRRGSGDDERAFVAEARVTGFLDHPNIVPVHDLGVDEEGETFLAMKLVGGLPWKELLHPATEAAKTRASGMELADHLDILIAVCNALGYAHRRGIIHRDLKPANVMVGEYGEVLVMDWGLAVSVAENDDAKLPRADMRIVGTPAYMAPEMVRGEIDRLGPWTDVYLLGAILCEIVSGRPPHVADSIVDTVVRAGRGDPPDLPPEVPEELRDICERAMERRIEERIPSAEVFRDLVRDFLRHRESSRLTQLARDRLLSALQAEGASRNPAAYAEIEEAVAGFRQALVLWDGNQAAARGESEARIALASIALDRGDLALAQSQLESIPAELAPELRAAVGTAMTTRERDRRRKRQLARAVVIAVAAIVLGLALGFVLIDGERRRADEEARRKAVALDALQVEKDRADEETARKAAALLDLRRLSDVKVLADLEFSSDRVSRPGPDAVERMEAFLAAARALGERLPRHERSLADVESRILAMDDSPLDLEPALLTRLQWMEDREKNAEFQLSLTESPLVRAAVMRARDRLAADRALLLDLEVARPRPRFAEPEDAWQYETLRGLVIRLRAALRPEIGVFARMERRLATARLARALMTDPLRRADWREAAARLAADPRFAGLELVPIEGLLPLGPDPASGLEEFLHLASHAGPLPRRAEDGRLLQQELTGVILVLVPGGESWRGAQAEDPDGFHHDPDARSDERPVHTVALDPFLIGKYELTQGQWLNVFDRQPSFYRPTFAPRPGAWLDLGHPVESLSWEDFRRGLAVLGLEFPTEARWEHAARGGRSSRWWCGDDPADLVDAANLPDRSARTILAEWESLAIWPDYEDGWPVHAPVSTFRPNPFGLHHVIGNVAELCLDRYSSHDLPVAEGDGRVLSARSLSRICRGGSFDADPRTSRSAARDYVAESYAHGSLGLRPALSLPPGPR